MQITPSKKAHTEHTVCRYGPNTAGTIGPIRLNSELALLARAHIKKTLIPPLDDLTLANLEVKRLAAIIGSVELGTVLESATVVDLDTVSSLGLATAFDRVRDFSLEVLQLSLARSSVYHVNRATLLLMMSAAVTVARANKVATFIPSERCERVREDVDRGGLEQWRGWSA